MDEVMETVITDMFEKATAKGMESGAKAERERIHALVKARMEITTTFGRRDTLNWVLRELEKDTPGEDADGLD